MKYLEIKEKLNNMPIFSPRDVFLVDPEFRLPTLYDWESRGLVKKIRSNNYVFSDFEPSDKDYYLIANVIYSPSYISLESALSYYGVIPESVPNITSVTTNKTNAFDTPFGKFTYSSIKNNLFFGYVLIDNDSQELLLASLEKTVLDYIYLYTKIDTKLDFESLRWNRDILLGTMDFISFEKYLKAMSNRALQKRSAVFLEYLHA